MNKNLSLIEDWERESLKDFVYLYEQRQLLDREIQQELHKRQPAEIVVINTSKLLTKQDEHKYNPLPF